jgi:hypothetical protein
VIQRPTADDREPAGAAPAAHASAGGWRQIARWVPPLLLAAAPFVYYWRATLGRVVLIESDGIAYHLPLRRLAARYLEQGYLPLWNPSVFSGFPFLAAMQPALFYPATWLFAWLPPVAAMNLQALTSFAVAALGMYAYAAALGCSRLPASFAAVTFAWNGFMLQRGIGHLVLLQGLVWLPVVLWSLERLRQRLRARYVLVGAGALAVVIFAGHPQMPTYTLFLAAAYIGFFAWESPPVGRLRFAAWAVVTLLAGVLLSAVQLLPARELGAQSVRASLSYEAFVSYSMPLRQLPMLLSPFYLDGRVGGAYFSVGTLFIALTGYVGIAAVVLALACCGQARRDRHVRFWLAVAVGALLLALGGSIPLSRLTYWVPLYNTFRAHGRMLVIFDCALAVLCGLALQRVGVRALLPAAALVAGATAAIALGTVTVGRAVWAPLASAELSGEALHALLEKSFSLSNPGLVVPVLLAVAVLIVAWAARRAPRASAAALLAVQIADLVFFGSWVDPPFPPADAVRDEVFDVAAVRPIAAPPFDFRTVSPGPMGHRADWQTPTLNGYDPLMLSRYAELAGGMAYPGVIPMAALRDTPGFLDLLRAKYLVTSFPPAASLAPVIDGIGFAAELLDQNLAGGGALALAMPVPTEATEIGAITAMANSVDLADGTLVARVTLWDATGAAEQIVLRAGTDTAEWAWERPDVAAVVRHRRARIADPATAGGWAPHHYYARLALPRRMAVTRMRIDALVPGVGLIVNQLSLFDAETGRSVPIIPVHMLLADSERWAVGRATDDLVVLENRHVLPRAWLVPATERLPPEAILATVRSGALPDGRRFDPRALALVEDVPGRDYAPLDPAAAVDVVRYEPNAIELATRAAGSAFLVLSEVFYPGWQASIDEQPAPIVRTNYALRGVELPAGAHQVRVVFHPASVMLGLAISLATAAALAAFALWSVSRRDG